MYTQSVPEMCIVQKINTFNFISVSLKQYVNKYVNDLKYT